MVIKRPKRETTVPLCDISCMWAEGVWVDASLIVGLPEQLLQQLWPTARIVLLRWSCTPDMHTQCTHSTLLARPRGSNCDTLFHVLIPLTAMKVQALAHHVRGSPDAQPNLAVRGGRLRHLGASSTDPGMDICCATRLGSCGLWRTQ